jgi:hypothetical protein
LWGKEKFIAPHLVSQRVELSPTLTVTRTRPSESESRPGARPASPSRGAPSLSLRLRLAESSMELVASAYGAEVGTPAPGRPPPGRVLLVSATARAVPRREPAPGPGPGARTRRCGLPAGGPEGPGALQSTRRPSRPTHWHAHRWPVTVTSVTVTVMDRDPLTT